MSECRKEETLRQVLMNHTAVTGDAIFIAGSLGDDCSNPAIGLTTEFDAGFRFNEHIWGQMDKTCKEWHSRGQGIIEQNVSMEEAYQCLCSTDGIELGLQLYPIRRLVDRLFYPILKRILGIVG